MVEAQTHLLEQEIQFKTLTLGDLLERSDEQQVPRKSRKFLLARRAAV